MLGQEIRHRMIFLRFINFWWGLIHTTQVKSYQCNKDVKRLNRVLQWGPGVTRAESMKINPLRDQALKQGLREAADSASLEIFKTYLDEGREPGRGLDQMILPFQI